MDSEECDWTAMEKEREQRGDGFEIRVINICYSAGRLTDNLSSDLGAWYLYFPKVEMWL